METLYNSFIKLFVQELNDLQIGLQFNQERITKLRELMYVIFLLEHRDFSREDSINIIELFL